MTNKNQTENFDAVRVEQILAKYPKLRIFICSGTVSLKATRDILGIDRYECYEMYLQLLEGGAVHGAGSNMYRASPELREYLKHNKDYGE